MLAVTILLVTLVGAINLLYCYSVMTRENNMLEMLCETDGQPDGPRRLSDTEHREELPDSDAARSGEGGHHPCQQQREMGFHRGEGQAGRHARR